jgi:hypothetical protein
MGVSGAICRRHDRCQAQSRLRRDRRNFSLPSTNERWNSAIDLDNGAIKWSFQGTPRDA